MKALLIIAHGSRRQKSNDEVIQIADKLSKQTGQDFDLIESAFLELAAPLIPDGIEQCIQAGAKEIIVLPYFLNSGRHVTEDIPQIIAEQKKRYPHTEIILRPHIGASPIMLELILHMATDK